MLQSGGKAYRLNIAASGAAEKISLITEIMTPGATAMMAADVIASADLVVLAIPLHKFRSLDPDSLRGKVVVDAMNYWAPIDGTLDGFESAEGTSSEIVAEYLAGARLVKSLNHIGGIRNLPGAGAQLGSASRSTGVRAQRMTSSLAAPLFVSGLCRMRRGFPWK
jgi:predicted dinucleotide-binding enzyme